MRRKFESCKRYELLKLLAKKSPRRFSSLDWRKLSDKISIWWKKCLNEPFSPLFVAFHLIWALNNSLQSSKNLRKTETNREFSESKRFSSLDVMHTLWGHELDWWTLDDHQPYNHLEMESLKSQNNLNWKHFCEFLSSLFL